MSLLVATPTRPAATTRANTTKRRTQLAFGGGVWRGEAKVTYTRMDHLEQRVADVEEFLGAIDPSVIDEAAADLDRLEREADVQPARNNFEGTRTLRIYNLLVHGPVWEKIPVHPAILPVVEGVLDYGCLVSSLSSIAILP